MARAEGGGADCGHHAGCHCASIGTGGGPGVKMFLRLRRQVRKAGGVTGRMIPADSISK
jgi:hypothetical protein